MHDVSLIYARTHFLPLCCQLVVSLKSPPPIVDRLILVRNGIVGKQAFDFITLEHDSSLGSSDCVIFVFLEVFVRVEVEELFIQAHEVDVGVGQSFVYSNFISNLQNRLALNLINSEINTLLPMLGNVQSILN